MEIDWKKAASGEKELYPAGAYNVEVVSWSHGGKSKAGNKMLKIVSQILKGPHYGKTIDDWITLTEASMWRLASFLGNCLSYDVSQLPAMDTDSQEFTNIMDACKGRKFWINIIEDAFDSKVKNKTAQSEPYAPDKTNPEFDPSIVEDVPSWVKGDGGEDAKTANAEPQPDIVA